MKPLGSLLLSAATSAAVFVTWAYGTFSGGMDVRETCELVAGEHDDPDYRAAHFKEFAQVFPLHNKCNASYDLVPGWVNAAILVLALATVVLLGKAVAGTVHHFRYRRRATAPSVPAGS
ncbi:hypothetical protein ABZ312_44450 [Streptomyces sp. NPDC006207]